MQLKCHKYLPDIYEGILSQRRREEFFDRCREHIIVIKGNKLSNDSHLIMAANQNLNYYN